MSMFRGSTILFDEGMTDVQVLIDYINNDLSGVIGEDTTGLAATGDTPAIPLALVIGALGAALLTFACWCDRRNNARM